MDTKINITGALAVLMAFIALIGGWYNLGSRTTANERAIVSLNVANQRTQENEQRLKDTLDRSNNLMGQMVQALDDHNIRIEIIPGPRRMADPPIIQGDAPQ